MSRRSKGKISISMMCADLLHLREDIALFEEEQIEYLHIDVMDGIFVPNLGLGIDYIKSLRELTDIPLDIHLMVSQPEQKLGWLGLEPRDSVTIHYESTPDVQRTLAKAKEYGCTVMLALNPGTPIVLAEELLDSADGITLLTVNPGFAGQKIVPSSFRKMEKLSKWLEENCHGQMHVQVDGNISFENARRLRALGADIFVAGSSSVFLKRKNDVMKENIQKLRDAVS